LKNAAFTVASGFSCALLFHWFFLLFRHS
jgi:hypothetical protein